MFDRRVILTALCLVVVGALAARADEESAPADPEIFSGPQKGEKLLPFKVRGVYDELAEKELDWVSEAGERPVFLVFVHKLTRPSLGLTRLLTSYAADRARGKDGGEERLVARIVWLDDDRSKAREYLLRARKSLAPRVPVGISVDGGEGPGAYGLNRNVTLTILVGVKGRVTANFALVQPSDTEAPKILAELARVIGEKPPGDRELARYRRGGLRDMRDRMQKTDARLRRLVNRVTARDLEEEAVTAAIAEVEKYCGEDRAKRRDLGVIASVIAAREGFATSGSERARKQIRDWARLHGPRARRQEQPVRPGNAELVAVLRPIIGKDLEPAEVDRIAKKAQGYIDSHPACLTELIRIGGVVIEKGYGTERAREHFKQWIERYGEKPEPGEE